MLIHELKLMKEEAAKKAKEEAAKKKAKEEAAKKRAEEAKARERALEELKVLSELRAEESKRNAQFNKLLLQFFKRAFEGYAYAGSEAISKENIKRLKKMGFRLNKLIPDIASNNAVYYDDKLHEINESILFYKNQIIENEASDLLESIESERNELYDLSPFLGMGDRYWQKIRSRSELMRDYVSVGKHLLRGIASSKSAHNARDKSEVCFKIRELEAEIGQVIDDNGNFLQGLVPTERQIRIRVGLESLKQQFEAFDRRDVQWDNLQSLGVSFEKNLSDKVDKVERHLKSLDQLDQWKTEKQSLRSKCLECVTWQEKPTASSSDDYRAIYWFCSGAADSVFEYLFQHIRKRFTKSKALFFVEAFTKSKTKLVLGNEYVEIPAYIGSKQISMRLKHEGLGVKLKRYSNQADCLEVSW